MVLSTWAPELAIVALSTLSAYGASRTLMRRWVDVSRIKLGLAAGLLPTEIILLLLIVGHVRWLFYDHTGYSPLVFLIVGFPLFLLNIVCNLVATRLAVAGR